MTDREANAVATIQQKIGEQLLILERANRLLIQNMTENTGHMPDYLVKEIKEANDFILYGEEVAKWFEKGHSHEKVMAMINQVFINFHLGFSDKPKERCEVLAAIAFAIM